MPQSRAGTTVQGCLIAVVIVGALAILGCVVLMVVAGLPQSDDAGRAATVQAPRPVAPPFAEIRANVESMTEAQWKRYLDGLAGYQVVRWTGWVTEVDVKLSGNYEVWIDMDSPDDLFSTQDVYFDVPEDVALRLGKGQQVRFSGTIKRVGELLGSISVYLVDAGFE